MFNILENPQFDAYTDWIGEFVKYGAPFAPIFLLFLEESGVPLPIPGDVYVAFIGYQVSLGRLTYFEAFIFLTTAVIAGSSILYYISAKWGRKLVRKIGALIHVDEKRLKQVEKWFRKYGVWVIIFGRHIPGLRVPITVFSGISGVSYTTFILSTFVSVVFWIAFYLYVGDTLGGGVMHKLHASPWYFVLFAIPLAIYIASFIHLKIKKK